MRREIGVMVAKIRGMKSDEKLRRVKVTESMNQDNCIVYHSQKGNLQVTVVGNIVGIYYSCILRCWSKSLMSISCNIFK